MKRIFVDANIFMRFFTRDSQGHHEKAVRLFTRAHEGKIELVSGPPVLFEIAWTLRSSYKRSKEEVLDVLSSILALSGLELTDAGLVEDAIRRAGASGVEFADAYIVASAEGVRASAVATFNRADFQRLGAKLHAL